MLVAIGGPPGSGKTTVARRLARERGWPRLGADSLGQVVNRSDGLKDGDAYWLAYDVVFALADEFLELGVSAVLDINLGWAFQWQQLDGLRQRHPRARILPVVLRCSRATCLDRIQQRHTASPAEHDPPHRFRTDPRILAVFEFVEALDKSQALVVDAEGMPDEVFATINRLVS